MDGTNRARTQSALFHCSAHEPGFNGALHPQVSARKGAERPMKRGKGEAQSLTHPAGRLVEVQVAPKHLIATLATQHHLHAHGLDLPRHQEHGRAGADGCHVKRLHMVHYVPDCINPVLHARRPVHKLVHTMKGNVSTKL